MGLNSLRSGVARIVQNFRKPERRSDSRKRPLRLESLETREMLSAVPPGIANQSQRRHSRGVDHSGLNHAVKPDV